MFCSLKGILFMKNSFYNGGLIPISEFDRHMTEYERICGTVIYNLRNRKYETGM